MENDVTDLKMVISVDLLIGLRDIYIYVKNKNQKYAQDLNSKLLIVVLLIRKKNRVKCSLMICRVDALISYGFIDENLCSHS